MARTKSTTTSPIRKKSKGKWWASNRTANRESSRKWREKKQRETHNLQMKAHLDELLETNLEYVKTTLEKKIASVSPRLRTNPRRQATNTPVFNMVDDALQAIEECKKVLLSAQRTQVKTVCKWIRYKAIVKTNDAMRQQTNWKKFDEGTLLERFSLLLQVKLGSGFEDWFTIKQSTLKDSGFGLFAARDFEIEDAIGVYLGAKTKLSVKSHSAYSIVVPKTNYRLDAKGGVSSGEPIFWGVHFVNDPGLKIKCSKAKYNCVLQNDLSLVAIQKIKTGAELFVDYQLNDT
jgi:hypothetical protein